MLDLDDIGAQNGELICGKRAGQDMRDVDYADSLERSHRRILLHWRSGERVYQSKADQLAI
jgi:hypothetical protein